MLALTIQYVDVISFNCCTRKEMTRTNNEPHGEKHRVRETNEARRIHDVITTSYVGRAKCITVQESIMATIPYYTYSRKMSVTLSKSNMSEAKNTQEEFPSSRHVSSTSVITRVFRFCSCNVLLHERTDFNQPRVRPFGTLCMFLEMHP